MPDAGENHSRTRLIGGFDSLFVPFGAAGLYYRRHAGLGSHLDPVGHREESVGSHDGSPGSLAGPFNRQGSGVYARGLSHPHSHRGAVFGQHDGIGFGMFDNFPGEKQVGNFFKSAA
jgi:hypothetical protein